RPPLTPRAGGQLRERGHFATRPVPHERLFDRLAARAERERLPAFIQQIGLEPRKHRHPGFAVLAAIAPVPIDCSTGALPSAHQEEAAVAAASLLLRCLIEREIALETRRVGLAEVDAVLVGSAAIAALALTFDPAHRRRRVGIACVPDAARAAVVTEQHLT